MIKAIIFDCFGVLTDDSWRAFRLSLPPDQSTLAQELNHQYDAGQMDKTTFISEVAKVTGLKPEDISSVIDTESAKNLPLLKYIAELKNRYKIGLISNVASNWIKEEFLTPQEQALFDDMVFSHEVMITKPDRRIFLLACTKLGVTAQEAVMIDDIQSYCDAAKSVGMKPIVYKDFGQMKQELEEILAVDSNN